MPQKITINDFSAGWVPSDNEINGRKTGLLKMDNLELDENGALVMIGGTVVKHTLATYNAHTLYSRVIAGARKDYSANTNGDIFRNTTSIGSSGDSTNAAFGTAFDYVLACSGNTRKKDNGSAAVNLGITPETVQQVITVTSIGRNPFKDLGDLTADTVDVVGSSTVVGDYIQITADGAGLGVVQTYNASLDPRNLNALVDAQARVGYGLPTDIIKLVGYTPSPIGKTLQLAVLLADGNATGDLVSDYYAYDMDLGTGAFDPETGTFTFIIERQQFTRVGTGIQDWGATYGFRLSYQGDAGDIVNILGSSSGFLIMMGGSNALNGSYQYMQVNVNKNGSYVGKSPAGITGAITTAINSQIGVLPATPADAQVNEVWLYRRGGLLDTWYRVGVFANPPVSTDDGVSDLAALQLNIKFDTNLVSIASSSISDKIISIVGPIEGRWFYFTTNFMYPSDINNPDLVNPAISVKTTGSSSEKLMWAFQVGEKSVLVGTSVDIYLLTGTFITQPDFTVDVYYNGYGTEYPPITYDATEAENGIFYLAKDGWRVFSTSGETRSLVAPNTDRLYRGQTCYGYSAPALTIQPGATRFPVLVAKNKLWCFITGTNRCEVFDFTRNYWRTFNYGLGDVTAATSTQDGQILCFYGTDKKIREIDIQTSKLIDAATQQTITLLTLVHDNETPKQRKDSSTLGFRVYTGASGTLTAKLTLEDLVTTNISTAIAASTFQEVNLDLSNISAVDIAKTYQLTLTGQLPDFRFTDAEIIFETRPLPVNFIRVQSNNYGTIARKRLYSIPFQIDTLGNNVVMTPLVDNSAQTTLTVSSSYKASFNYKFPLSAGDVPKGRDYEYTLQCTTGLFEFFGFEEPRGIEVFPDPVRSHVVPVSNYGTTARKRLRVLRFILDPLSTTVTFTPIIDGVSQATSTFTTAGKRTCFHYFTSDQIGVDFSGTFSASGDFELWQVLEPQAGDIEVFPERVKYFVIPVTNYGSTGRKRLRLMRFVLDPLSATVTLTPIIDGISQNASTFSVAGKRTVFHYFTDDEVGVDFSGIFSGTDVFELWEILPPQEGDVEPFPDSTKFLILPNNNYGSAQKKRVRVLPFVIDTKGEDVTFTAVVDGVDIFPPVTFNTDGKETVRYYFKEDVFGVDYSGRFEGEEEFEFWSALSPDVVQVLPIARRFDQVGPAELFQYGKLSKIELRVLPIIISDDPTSEIPYEILFNDNTTYTNVFEVINNREASYLQGLPKGNNGNIVRITLGPVSHDFHRFYIRILVSRSGRDTENEWISLGGESQ